MGQPAQVVHLRPSHNLRPRRDELPVHAGGSMSGDAGWLLRLAHRLTQAAPQTIETWDTAPLTEQVQHLHGAANRVMWGGPRRGKVRGEPVSQGVLAVLADGDDCVTGDSPAAYAEVVKVVAHA